MSSMAAAWGREIKNIVTGERTQAFLEYGAVAGMMIQFPDNAPVTYAEYRGNRLGAFESWTAAEDAIIAEARKSALTN